MGLAPFIGGPAAAAEPVAVAKGNTHCHCQDPGVRGGVTTATPRAVMPIAQNRAQGSVELLLSYKCAKCRDNEYPQPDPQGLHVVRQRSIVLEVAVICSFVALVVGALMIGLIEL